MNNTELKKLLRKKLPNLDWQLCTFKSTKQNYLYAKTDSLELLDIYICYRLIEETEYSLFEFNILSKEGEILYDFSADEDFENLLEEGLFALKNLYTSELKQLT